MLGILGVSGDEAYQLCVVQDISCVGQVRQDKTQGQAGKELNGRQERGTSACLSRVFDATVHPQVSYYLRC